MKKLISVFFTGTIVILCGAVFTKCNSSDYNKDEVSTPVLPDSTVTKPDSMPMMSDTINQPMRADSASMDMNNSSMNRDTGLKSTKSGKVRKPRISIILPTRKSGAMDMDKDGYYSNVEVLPAFPGGQRSLEKFFEDNIVYPDPASENGTEGLVTLNFIVDERGKVFNPVVTSKKLGDGIEEEAIRVFNQMPVWTAGKIKGNNVKTRYSLPIRFQIN